MPAWIHGTAEMLGAGTAITHVSSDIPYASRGMSTDAGSQVSSSRDGRLDAFQAQLERELPQLTADERLEVARSVDVLVTALVPERIYIFGSYARGTPVRGLSDVDLLVVVPESTEPAYRRAQHAYAAIGSHELPLDILVLTRDEFEQQSSAEWTVQAGVQRDGRLLYAA